MSHYEEVEKLHNDIQEAENEGVNLNYALLYEIVENYREKLMK